METGTRAGLDLCNLPRIFKGGTNLERERILTAGCMFDACLRFFSCVVKVDLKWVGSGLLEIITLFLNSLTFLGC